MSENSGSTANSQRRCAGDAYVTFVEASKNPVASVADQIQNIRSVLYDLRAILENTHTAIEVIPPDKSELTKPGGEGIKHELSECIRIVSHCRNLAADIREGIGYLPK